MDLYHRNHAPTRPRILVAVPAQNESAALPHLIDSLGKQVDAKGRARNDFHTVILVNNSSDNSESVAVRSLRANQLPGTVFSLRTRHRPTIGYLRRILMNRCLEIMQPTRQTGSLEEWIAWTDADCTVHNDWITHTDQLMQKGAGAVGGHIEVTYGSEGEAHHVHRLRYEYHRHLNLLWRRLSDHRDDQIFDSQQFARSNRFGPALLGQIGATAHSRLRLGIFPIRKKDNLCGQPALSKKG